MAFRSDHETIITVNHLRYKEEMDGQERRKPFFLDLASVPKEILFGALFVVTTNSVVQYHFFLFLVVDGDIAMQLIVNDQRL